MSASGEADVPLRTTAGEMPRALLPGETAVYRFFDRSDQLLYVGISSDPFRRWSGHAERRWWRLAVRYTIDWYPSEADARDVERSAIKTEAPQHNIHNTRKHAEAIRLGVARANDTPAGRLHAARREELRQQRERENPKRPGRRTDLES